MELLDWSIGIELGCVSICITHCLHVQLLVGLKFVRGFTQFLQNLGTWLNCFFFFYGHGG